MIETGVLFDDIHSFRDLNLVLAPFVLPPAKPKTTYIDVPGRDGSIDVTEATGKITYKDREFSFTFTVFPEDTMTFEERQTVVSNALNGKRCKITLDKDPDYYLDGRCTVDKHFANKKLRQIVVSVRCAPYKMKQQETVAIVTLKQGDEKTYIFRNGKKEVQTAIQITASKMAAVAIYNAGYDEDYKNYLCMPGTMNYVGIYLHEGNNTVKVKAPNCDATIKFVYREGDL